MKKGSKKGYTKKEGTYTRKNDLSKAMCFQCHEMGDCANQCPMKKRKKGMKYIVSGIVKSVEENPY
jgi:succinate dehydrogenase/fumarate reductase-like Fe-S protein